MKKIGFLSIVLAIMLSLSTFLGCGTSSNSVAFWFKGSEEEIEVFNAMCDEFNKTYGKDHGIEVKATPKSVGSYDTNIQASAGTKSGPDVFILQEDDLKKNINIDLVADITNELNAVTDIDIDDIYSNVIERYRYDKTDNSSLSTDPLYGLPLDTRPSALYYNETLFRQAGILVISVNEEDVDEFWAGEKADHRGLTKSDYIAKYEQMEEEGIISSNAVSKLKAMQKLPKKGYYRERPRYNGATWNSPTNSEVLIFNNRIAMNWDEIEDLSMLFDIDKSKERIKLYENNKGELLADTTNGSVEYGLFTEWWFMYGWSVGGDCLNDLTGNGDYNFSLLDPNKNYIVAEGCTYTGEYTGKVYQAGETIEFLDKMDIAKDEVIAPNNDGNYSRSNGDIVGVRASVVENESLLELASTREAFERYIKLATNENTEINGEKGLGISPNPNLFGTRKDFNYFFSGKIAMLVQYSLYMPAISKFTASYGFDYDVAPLVVYKEYENPGVATDDTVKAQGKVAGQSNSIGMVVRSRSTKKYKAAAFIKWMASETAQRIKAKHGFFPNQESLLNEVEFTNGVAPKNIDLFNNNIKYQSAGDWWYLKDYGWVNTWANDLNSYVRNGDTSKNYDWWKNQVVQKTNTVLKDY